MVAHSSGRCMYYSTYSTWKGLMASHATPMSLGSSYPLANCLAIPIDPFATVY